MNQTNTRPILVSLFIALSMAMLALAILGLRPLGSEYWWHIGLGEFIATWQRVPDQQLFLFTVDSELPWTFSSWMGALILYHLHYQAGAELPLLIHNIFSAFSVALVAFFLSRRARPLSAVFIPAILLSLAFAFFTEVAPFSLSLPVFTAAFLVLSSLALSRGRIIAALFLPLSVAALANLDFPAAAIIALLSLAVGLYALFIARRRAEKPDQTSTITAAIALTAPLGLFAFAYGPSHLPVALSQALAAPAQILVAISLCATLALAAAISNLLSDTAARKTAPKLLIAVGFLIVSTLAVMLQPGVPTRATILPYLNHDLRTEVPLAGTMSRDFPLRCAEELNRLGRPLQLFHDERHAGFLLYHLFDARRPEPLLFQDQRGLLSPEIEALIPLFKTDPIARGVFQQMNVTAVVVHPDEYPALITDLEASPQWTNLDEYLNDGFACFIPVSWAPSD